MTYGEGFTPGNYYFSFAAIAFMVLFLIFSFINKADFKKTSRMMRITGIMALIGCLSELISAVAFARSETPDTARRVLALVNYSTMLMCAMYFNRYTLFMVMKDGHKKQMKIYDIVNAVIVIIFHLVLIGDLIFKYMFEFEDGVAKGGPLMMFMGYGAPLLYLLAGIAAIIFFRKKLTAREFYTLLTTHLIVTMGAMLQGITNDKVLLVSFSITVGLYVLYTLLETPDYHRLLESNRKLAEAEKAAKAASKAKTDFLSSMSHEIRTPLNAVLGMNELTRMELEDPSIPDSAKVEKAEFYSERIRESGEALMYVINDILDISKIESGKMDIINAPYHMMELLDELCTHCRMISKGKDLLFESDIDLSLPGYVNGDRVRVRQMIVNLLNNAVKYTESGKITLKVRGTTQGDTVYYDIDVTDTGIGIKEENIEHVFNAFDRFDMEKTHYIQGTGLGLSIVKNIVTMMGGTVSVKSVYGQGSTFSLHVPQQVIGNEKLSDHVAEKKKTVSPGEGSSFEGARILVVDDTTTNITVAKSFLGRLSVVTDSAESGQEALIMIADNKYDLILLDHMMPNMTGDVVLSIVRGDPERYSLNKDTPIVVMTANAISGEKERYISEYGFDGYLAKPFRFGDLESILKKYIREGTAKECPVPEKTDSEKKDRKMEAEGKDAGKDGKTMDARDAIDKATGLMMCETEDIYRAVIEAYLSEEQSSIDALNEAFETENWTEYRTQVHKLKSSSKTVGANAFSEFSLQMETCAKDIIAENETEKALDFIRNKYGEYLEVFRKVCENLNNV